MSWVVSLILLLISCNSSHEKKYSDAEIKVLIGLDENGNGVRDDVESWIDENIKGKEVKRAFYNNAKYIRHSFNQINDKDSSRHYLTMIGRSSDCAEYILKEENSELIEKTRIKTGISRKILELRKKYNESVRKMNLSDEEYYEKVVAYSKKVKKENGITDELIQAEKDWKQIMSNLSLLKNQFYKLNYNTKERKEAERLISSRIAGKGIVLANSKESACN